MPSQPPSSAVPPRPFGPLTWPLRLALHATALGSSIYAFSSLSTIEGITEFNASKLYGGQYMFLTINGLTVTTVAFIAALCRDLLPSLPAWIDTLHYTTLIISLPFEFLISALYWGLRLYDPSLLIPPKPIYDVLGNVIRTESVEIPFWIDASLHAFPGVFLVIEYLVFTCEQRGNARAKAAGCAIAGVAYIVWSEHCARQNGHSAYPLLDLLSPTQKLGLYLGCTATVLLTSLSLERVYDVLHRRPSSTTTARKTA